MKNIDNSKNLEITRNFIPLANSALLLPSDNRSALMDELARHGISSARVCIRIYPYRTALSRLTRRHGQLRLGLHPVLRDAPEEIFRAALRCLFQRIDGQPADPMDRLRVRNYCHESLESVNIDKRSVNPADIVSVGRHYDLGEIFDKVNRRYFNGDIQVHGVGWSRRVTRRKLAWLRTDALVIMVSRLLDHSDVPRYFLEFVLYHEMLHILLPGRRQGSRMVYHHGDFRAAERAFPHYEKAKRFELKLGRINNKTTP